MCVLHYVEDVEDVGLVLQRRTLSQLPHQRCKVRVAMRVSRKVQISSTVGLQRDFSDLCISLNSQGNVYVIIINNKLRLRCQTRTPTY